MNLRVSMKWGLEVTENRHFSVNPSAQSVRSQRMEKEKSMWLAEKHHKIMNNERANWPQIFLVLSHLSRATGAIDAYDTCSHYYEGHGS